MGMAQAEMKRPGLISRIIGVHASETVITPVEKRIQVFDAKIGEVPLERLTKSGGIIALWREGKNISLGRYEGLRIVERNRG